MNARIRIAAALLLAVGMTACKKKPAPGPQANNPARPPAAAGQQKAPPPGTQKGAPAGSQKAAAPGTQKAAPAQPGQQKAAPAPAPAPAQPGQQRAAPAPGQPGQAAQQQKGAPGRPGAPAVASAPATAAPAPGGAARRPDSVGLDSSHIDYRREVYSYQGGPRDPFTSLLTTNESQVSVNDLHLVSILYDARGGRSVAIVRSRNSPRAFRLRRGESIGRLRVIQIRQYEVVFQVEEFGFERQEVLSLPRAGVP